MDPTRSTSIFAGPLTAQMFGVVFFLLVALGCVSDIRSRRIPNSIVLTIAASGLGFALWQLDMREALISSFGGMSLGLAIWIGFYALGVLGAGDVKFFAAAAAWLGPAGAWRAALVAAAAGGILAVAFLVKQSKFGMTIHRIALMPLARSFELSSLQDMSTEEARRQLPYGVALGVGVATMALFPSFLR